MHWRSLLGEEGRPETQACCCKRSLLEKKSKEGEETGRVIHVSPLLGRKKVRNELNQVSIHMQGEEAAYVQY